MDAIDLTTPQGQLMFGIVASMAQFEKSMIQQRVKSGMAWVIAASRILLWPR